MKLVAFDGDETLWTPLSGVNLCDRTSTDPFGNPDFTYTLLSKEPPIARRDDGARFALRPEAAEVMATLHKRGVLVGVLSYNHEGPIRRILDAFGLLQSVDYIVAEWHSDKDRMLKKMLAAAQHGGHKVEPSDALLVDDDPWQIYRGQCARMGAEFRCFGVDITDLREILPIVAAGG